MTKDEEHEIAKNIAVLLMFGYMVSIVVGVLFACGDFLEQYLFWRWLIAITLFLVALRMRTVAENYDSIKTFLRKCFKYSIEKSEVRDELL